MAAPMKHVFRVVRACSDTFYKHIRYGYTYRTRSITEYVRLLRPRKYSFYSKSWDPSWKHGSFVGIGILSWSLFTMKEEEADETEKEDADDKKDVDVTDPDNGDKDSSEDKRQIEHYVRLAKMAQMKKEFEEADMYYHEALKVTDKKFRRDKISKKFSLQARTYIFDGMADMALSRGQFDKAESLYKDTLKGYLESGGARKDNAVMELTLKLSSLYAITKKDHEARLGLTTVIECQEEKVKTNPDSDIDTYGLLGIALQTYGRYLLNHNELEKAEAVFVRCAEICTRAVGENSSQMLKVLNDLAAVHIIQAKYAKAEENLQKALVISENMESSDTVYAIYSNLGAISLKLSELDMAESRCSTAFKLAKKAKDEFAQKQAMYCLEKVKEARQSSPVK